MPADVLGTDSGAPVDCCVVGEGTVLALVSEKNSNEAKQFRNFSEYNRC